MKKITLLCMFFIACLGWQGHAQCNYSLHLADSFGNGWTGNTMDVLVNGTVVLDDVTLTSGTEGSMLFPVNTGEDVTTIWNNDGSYGYETSYEILDSEGNVMGSGAESSITSGTITALCPSCQRPTDLAATLTSLNTVMLSWTSGGDTFDISWGEGTFEAGVGTIVNGFANGGTLSGLTPDTAYQYYVRNDCGTTDGTSTWVGPYSFYAGYCIATGTYNNYRITGMATEGGFQNISNLENGTANPYSDYSNMVVSQSVGADIIYILNGTNSPYAIKIWVDYDNDFVFEDEELVASHTSSSSSATYTGSISIPGDQALGDYRMRIRSNYYFFGIPSCGDAQNGHGETEDYTLSVVTPPSCLQPTSVLVDAIDQNTVDISWTAENEESAWNVVYGESGFDPETAGTTINVGTDPNTTLSGLTADTNYEVYVQAVCGDVDGTSTWAGPYSFLTGYCIPIGVTGNYYRITGMSTEGGFQNISNLGNGTTNPYSDYSNMSVIQSVGGDISYTVNVTTGAGIKIWVDYDENFVFEVEELVASQATSSSSTTYTGSFTISGDQAPGDYRMRIRSNYYFFGIPSCGDADYGYGEAEDYTLSVVTPPSCLQPNLLSVDAIGQNTADISWVSADIAFNISWGTLGYTPGDANEAGTDAAISVTHQINGLAADTDYDVYVQTDCGGGDLSTWVGPISFKTDDTINFINSSYNQDVIGEGSGPIENFTTNDFDGGGYYLISETYQSPSETGPATFGLPSNGLFKNQLSEGPNYYKLQDYTGNNAFQLRTNSDAGSIQFENPASVIEMYLLVTSAGASSEITGTIDFQDGTFQTIDETIIPDWFFSIILPIAYQGFGRLSSNGHYEPNSSNPRFYQLSIVIDQTNANKLVSGISLSRTDAGTGVFSLMAVEGMPTPTCVTPTNLSNAGLSANSVDLTWDAAPSQAEWTVVYGTEGFDPETEGTSITVNTDPNTTVSGLIANTAYNIYVQANCGGSTGVSAWAGPLAFSTLCNPVTSIPYTENFDTYGVVSDAFPDCWTRPVTNTSGSVWPSIVVHGPTNSLKFQSVIGTPTYAVSPAFTEDIQNLRVSFMLEREGTASGTMDIGVMSDPQDPSTFELVQTIDPSNIDNFIEYTFYLNSTVLSGGNNYIALRHNSDNNDWFYWLDDFTVELIPSCIEPTDPMITALSTTTADFSWTGDATATNGYVWSVFNAGNDPATATAVTTGTTDVGILTAQATGLSSGANYDFYVGSDCGSDGTSDLAGPLNFSTSIEACGNPYTSCYENNGYLVGTYTVSTPGDHLTINITAGSTESGWDDLVIYDGSGIGGIELYRASGDQTGVSVTSTTGIMTVYVDSDSVVNCSSGSQTTLAFNFTCTAPLTCPQPTNLTIDSFTDTTATIVWEDAANASSGYVWRIVLEGTDPMVNENIVALGTTPAGVFTVQATGLSPLTAYDIYVGSDCNGVRSDLAGPLAFSTLCNPVTSIPYTENFDTYGVVSDAFPDCWTRPVTNTSGYVWPSIVVHGPTNSLKFQSVIGTPTYAVSPAFTEDIQNLRVSFMLEREGTSSGTMDIGVMSDPQDPSTFELVQTIDPSNIDNFIEYTFDLNSTVLSGGNNYIALRHNSDNNDWFYWLDDFTVELIPSCIEPTDPMITALSTTTADFSWTDDATATNGYVWSVFNADDDPATATAVATGTTDVGILTAQATGLSSGANYDFYVGSNCGSDGISDLTGPLNFLTSIEACGNSYTSCYEDNGYLVGTYTVSTPGDHLTINFTAGSTESGWDDLVIYDGSGTGGTELYRASGDQTGVSVTSTAGTITVYVDSDVSVSCSAGSQTTLAFNFTCTAPLTCPQPTNLTIDSFTDTTATIVWEDAANASGGYVWGIVLEGTDPMVNENIVALGTTLAGVFTAQATGLSPLTAYDAYVGSNCGTSGNSATTGPITFTTIASPPINDNLADAIALTLDAECTGDAYTNVKATAETGEPESLCSATGELHSVWFSFVAPASGNVRISTDILPGDIYDTNLALYATPATLGDASTFGAAIACAADNGEGNYLMSIIEASGLTSGATYFLQVDGWNVLEGTFCITVESRPDFYYENGNWTPNAPGDTGNPVTASDVVSILDGTTTFDTDLEMNKLIVMTGAVLEVEQAMTVNGDLTNNGEIIFKNDATKLGQLGDMTGNTISGTGTITVERYIPARDSEAGDVNGAYRFITSAVTSTDNIHINWQENGTMPTVGDALAGYGMFITGTGGSANGFDQTNANNPSMSTFDNATQAYDSIPNTNVDVLTAGTAYSAYVWGDRTVDIFTGNDPQATSTTLRATGSLVTGNQAGPTMSSLAGGFNLIGNPYQAIVNMNNVMSSTTNINTNSYYVWDPNLGTRGAYATVMLKQGTPPEIDPTPTTSPSTSAANQYLMPGQAVWVVTENASAASLTFEESDKAVTADPTDVFRPAIESAFMELQLFQADRYANGFTLSDAVRIDFSETGDNAVLTNDAQKLSNIDENLGRSNGDDLLSVENRALPTDGEVLPLFLNQYRTSNYVFNAVVSNLPEGTTAFLMDNYLNLKTELVNGQATAVSFSVDASNVASIAPDRFDIIFERDEMGVNENNFSGISIHPNPVAGNEFFIAASGLSGEKVQVNLYNILGQKVFTLKNTVNSNDRVSVPTANLEAGVYLVEMNHNGKTFTGKVVVE